MSNNEKCTCKACKNCCFHSQICKFVTFLFSSSSWYLQCTRIPSFRKYTPFFVTILVAMAGFKFLRFRIKICILGVKWSKSLVRIGKPLGSARFVGSTLRTSFRSITASFAISSQTCKQLASVYHVAHFFRHGCAPSSQTDSSFRLGEYF